MTKKENLEILLLEDNQGDVELIKLAFQAGDGLCNLSVVNDGVEAIDFLYKRGKYTDASTPHVMLIDLNMPRMDGKEFLNVVKNDEQLKVIPAIILTSSENPSEILECYKLHANCYVLKPSSIDSLFQFTKHLEDFWGNSIHPSADVQKTP